VESHQGRMLAENLYNGEVVIGCRFSFWLPCQAQLFDGGRTGSFAALPT
jgi:hypothetical protein